MVKKRAVRTEAGFGLRDWGQSKKWKDQKARCGGVKWEGNQVFSARHVSFQCLLLGLELTGKALAGDTHADVIST